MSKWNIRGIALEAVEEAIETFPDCGHDDLRTLFDDAGTDILHGVCMPLKVTRDFNQSAEVEELACQIVNEIDLTVHNAANEAIRTIQEKLGVTSGDFAGMYFCGEEFRVLLPPLYRYMLQEMKEKDRQQWP